MPEMLDSTSRITTLCRERGIVVGLMTDGRFSGGSVGLVIGHVGPEAAVGGPIGLIEEDDDVIVDLNTNEINCLQLNDEAIHKQRKSVWDAVVAANGGTHPAVGDASTRLLNRMRCSAVSAVQGAGMHPGGSLWVSEPRAPSRSGFTPSNNHRDG
jgi:dihydroxy-acid dehydratase